MAQDSPGRPSATGRPQSRRSASTAADLIHHWLREEIVSLRSPPGAAISEKEIASAHGVSRTPVREALLRLADEGLVEITPKSGTRIARIPVVVLADAMCAREAIELMLARKAAARARPSDVATMRAVILRQRECLDMGDAAGFHEADEALHFAIAEAAGHPGVWAMVLQIKVQLDRLRHMTLPNFEWLRHVIGEHEAIVEAIASGDPDRAAAAMHVHFQSVRQALDESSSVKPEYFVGLTEAFAR